MYHTWLQLLFNFIMWLNQITYPKGFNKFKKIRKNRSSTSLKHCITLALKYFLAIRVPISTLIPGTDLILFSIPGKYDKSLVWIKSCENMIHRNTKQFHVSVEPDIFVGLNYLKNWLTVHDENSVNISLLAVQHWN